MIYTSAVLLALGRLRHRLRLPLLRFQPLALLVVAAMAALLVKRALFHTPPIHKQAATRHSVLVRCALRGAEQRAVDDVLVHLDEVAVEMALMEHAGPAAV